MSYYTRARAGARAKIHGASFESEITSVCSILQSKGLMCVQKTPEPVRQVGAMGANGTFTAVYTSAAQPDFKGVLKGGRCIVFEAKASEGDTITYDRVTAIQRQGLADYERFGALAYVVISLGSNVYVVPYRIWLALPSLYGQKTYRHKHLKHFLIKDMNQIIKALVALRG